MSRDGDGPRKDDRVRIVLDGKYVREGDPTDHDDDGFAGYFVDVDGVMLYVPPSATVEVLERADDPTLDPIWTVREVEPKPPMAMSNTVVKFGDSFWLYPSKLGNGYGRLDWAKVRESKVIGAVPGTDAARFEEAIDEVLL